MLLPAIQAVHGHYDSNLESIHCMQTVQHQTWQSSQLPRQMGPTGEQPRECTSLRVRCRKP